MPTYYPTTDYPTFNPTTEYPTYNPSTYNPATDYPTYNPTKSWRRAILMVKSIWLIYAVAYCRGAGLMQDWENSALGVCGPERSRSGLSPK